MASDKASRQNAKIFIKRVQAADGGGHHGGAWKVAYADFVTAMMAFFLLMWLLNATTEKQRKGLADYFNPTVVQNSAGGGDGPYGGDSPQGEANLLNVKAAQMDEAAFAAAAKEIETALRGTGGDSMQQVNLLRHVITRISDEGLVIELGDLTQDPLFETDTAQPTAPMRDLAKILTRLIGRYPNNIAIQGHVRSYPEVLANPPVWALSNARAHALRNLMQEAGYPDRQVKRVAAFADHANRSRNPMDVANNRIEVILLK